MPNKDPYNIRSEAKAKASASQSTAPSTDAHPPLDLTDHLLLAMPLMTDPNFSGTVVYIVEHGDKGAMGLVINRTLELTVSDLFERIDLKCEQEPLANQPVLLGGPVHNDRGFVLHRPIGNWSSSIQINDAVALTSSRDVLESVAKGAGPQDVIVALGYAGWGAGQIEAEIAQNAWLTVRASDALIFDVAPKDRHAMAFRLLGVDPLLMSGTAGHA